MTGSHKAILRDKQFQSKKLNNLIVIRLENCSHGPDKVMYYFLEYTLTFGYQKGWQRQYCFYHQKNADINKMKETFYDTSKFEQVNIEEVKQLTFF